MNTPVPRTIVRLDYIYIRLGNFLVSIQLMHGQFGKASPGKASSHSSALPSFFFSFCSLLCAMFSCFHTTSWEVYSFTTDGYGVIKQPHKFGCVPYTRRGVAGTNKSAQELTRGDTTTVSHPAQPEDRTQGLRVLIPILYPLSYTCTFPCYEITI